MPDISRPLRRLHKLAESALVTTGAEQALVCKTILKILDECSDTEYNTATEDGPLRLKLIKAGIEFDFED